jgi:hypothetical protein
MSMRAAKEDIHYLSPAEIDQVAAATEAMRLASYRYRNAAFGAGKTAPQHGREQQERAARQVRSERSPGGYAREIAQMLFGCELLIATPK